MYTIQCIVYCIFDVGQLTIFTVQLAELDKEEISKYYKEVTELFQEFQVLWHIIQLSKQREGTSLARYFWRK